MERVHTVGEIMRREFIAISPEESLEEALQLVRMARLRHLPVVRGGILVGIVSYRDLLDPPVHSDPDGAWEERGKPLRAIAIERAMHAPPEVVTPSDSLEDAAARMFFLKIGCLPVVELTPEGPRAIGLVTESDLLRAAYDPWFLWASA